MAEDYPDYSPSYLVRYGSPKQKSFLGNATPSTTTELFSVFGKGIIYSGFINADKLSTSKADKIKITIDNQVYASRSFEFLDLCNIISHFIYPTYLAKFDDTNFFYVVGIGSGITFEKSIVIEYEETYGHSPGIVAFLNYALLK